jgi:hypothetical protein
LRGSFGCQSGHRRAELPGDAGIAALPIEVWGPPGTRARLQVRVEDPAGLTADAGAPFELTFDASGICYVGASLAQLRFVREGVHAMTLCNGGHVLVRRRVLVRQAEAWE